MKNQLSRRKFIQASALATGGLLAKGNIELEAYPSGLKTKKVAPGDRIRFGIIGVGMQGSGLLSGAISIPGAECAGAADLYDGRHLLAREITANPKLFTTRRYKDLLDNKDIDCIIAAVPDHWHKKVVVDCCDAGKDVYIEKPMTHFIPEGFEMIDAAKRNNRIIQVGSQRTSSVLCDKSHELYSSGVIGEIEHVELSLGRNDPTGAWQYPPPTDLSTETLDWDVWLGNAPKIPFNPLHFARWRCWKEYGTGVGGDLMVHLLSGMLFTLGWNEIPRSAQSLGGIFRWKDGRNMPDLHLVLFDYHGVPVYVRLGLGTESVELARFFGPKGILDLQEFGLQLSPQTGVDQAPSYYAYGFPQEMREKYFREWEEKNGPKPGKEPLFDKTSWSGHDYDDMVPHIFNFFESVKSRKPVHQDVVFGNNAAIACHMANESYFRQKQVFWDEASRTLKS
jgi:predicted dehydrogenase